MSRRQPLAEVTQLGPKSEPDYEIGTWDVEEGEFVHVNTITAEEAMDLFRALAETLGYTFQRWPQGTRAGVVPGGYANTSLR